MELIFSRKSRSSLRKSAERVRILFQQELRELQNPAHSAKKLAAAFALGTLLSFIPVPLLDSMLVGVVLTRFKQVHRAPLFIARLLWNDLLVFPIYGPAYRLGSALLAPLLHSSPEMPGVRSAVAPLLNFTLGSILMATSAAAAGYMLFWLAVQLLRLRGEWRVKSCACK